MINSALTLLWPTPRSGNSFDKFCFTTFLSFLPLWWRRFGVQNRDQPWRGGGAASRGESSGELGRVFGRAGESLRESRGESSGELGRVFERVETESFTISSLEIESFVISSLEIESFTISLLEAESLTTPAGPFGAGSKSFTKTLLVHYYNPTLWEVVGGSGRSRWAANPLLKVSQFFTTRLIFLP